MNTLKREVSKKDEKSFQVLSNRELSLVKGGDQGNTENGDDED
jgi:hypothetical protein